MKLRNIPEPFHDEKESSDLAGTHWRWRPDPQRWSEGQLHPRKEVPRSQRPQRRRWSPRLYLQESPWGVEHRTCEARSRETFSRFWWLWWKEIERKEGSGTWGWVIELKGIEFRWKAFGVGFGIPRMSPTWLCSVLFYTVLFVFLWICLFTLNCGGKLVKGLCCLFVACVQVQWMVVLGF